MQNFKSLFVFLFGISGGIFIWGISLIFLNKTPIFYVPFKKNYFFYPINLTEIFFNTEVETKKPVEILKGLKLKALYFDGKKGFIIIENKGKSVFIDLGKMYKGYKLVKIGFSYALFEKNGKKYKLQMEKSKFENNFSIKQNVKENKIFVSRKIFNEYVNNLNKIWNNIGIVKTDEGYMITYIKPHSIFEKIGLKKGDILLEVNGRKLKNNADAWNLYRNATKFNSFEIKILRNHKLKVLYYEMD